MSEHTPGLLEHSSAGHGWTGKGLIIDEYFIRRPGDDVAVAADIVDPETGKPSEANAKRLVACWNACIGLDDLTLEGLYLSGDTIRDRFDLMRSDASEDKAQRDELLAALEGLVALTKPILDALLLSAGDRDSILLAGKINNGHPDRAKLIAKAKGPIHPSHITQAEFDAAPTAGPTIAEMQKEGTLPVEIIELTPVAFDAFEKQLQENPLSKNEALKALFARPTPWAEDNLLVQRNTLLDALLHYEAFRDQMFGQCCSNPVFDSWGKQVDMTLINEAHELAQVAIKAAGGAQ